MTSSRKDTPLTKAEMRRVFYGLMLGLFLSAVNQTIVATALPTIGRQFGDFDNLSWVIIAYLLSSTVVAPLYGKLSDIHGRRVIMLWALGLFVAGSALSALAPDMATLIAGRTLQGLGGGGIVPLTQTTVADMVSPRERGAYQAYLGVSWVTAGLAGPVLGGVIADYLHWSMIFWLNVPLGLLGALTVSRSMKRLPRYERPHKLDFVGGAVMVAAATLFLLALTSGGVRIPWLSPAMVGMAAGSLLLTLAFAWWMRRAPEPFLPLSVLGNPVVRMGTLASAGTLGAVIGLSVYLPLYYQVVHKLSATQAGLALCPVVVLSTPGSFISGRAMMHMRHYKVSPYIGLSLSIAMTALLVAWPAMPLSYVLIVTAILGFGVGTVYPVVTVSIQNAVPSHQVGTATGSMNFFRSLASAFVVAVMGAILLAGFGATPERGIGVELLVAMAGQAGLDVAAVFRFVFAAALAFLAIALLAVILMEERPLRGPAKKTEPPLAPEASVTRQAAE
jgi:EmrB/QacA subfamily drug resistance transporter